MAAATCCFAFTSCERMSRMIWFSIFSGCSNSEITAFTFERKSIAILSKIFISRWVDSQKRKKRTATERLVTPQLMPLAHSFRKSITQHLAFPRNYRLNDPFTRQVSPVGPLDLVQPLLRQSPPGRRCGQPSASGLAIADIHLASDLAHHI